MQGKSHLLGLMARRETVRLMQSQTELRQIRDRHAEAADLAERLSALLENRRTGAPGVVRAWDLHRAHRLDQQLSEQAGLSAARAEELGVALAEATAAMAQQDHRTRHLAEAAQIARSGEAEARQSRADALASGSRRR